MLLKFISENFITIFLIVGFSMKLSMHKSAQDTQMRYLWLSVLCAAFLVVADSLEGWAAADPARRVWRTLFSVIGYSLRPVAALSVALVIAYQWKRKLLLWLPAILNALIMCTAFFSPVAFSYNDSYEFVRGPLGFIVFAAGFFYIGLVVVLSWKWFKEGHRTEGRIVVVCALFTAASVLLGMVIGENNLNAAIMISVIFYYMFIRSRDNNRDYLTGLGNRHAFYEDAEAYQSQVTAVASLDMNGLKRLNDTQGHDAGDRALAQIGQCLQQASGKNVLCYRMGGDEFMILFLRTKDEGIRFLLGEIKARLQDRGCSVSVGYACRTGKETISELYKLSDHQMYQDKSRYYSQPGHDRRGGE